MKLVIEWSKEAEETFNLTIAHIEEKWGFNSAQKFVKAAFETIDNIAINPFIFAAIEQEGIRKAYISKQTSLFYEVVNNKILLLFFWDNRQLPIL